MRCTTGLEAALCNVAPHVRDPLRKPSDVVPIRPRRRACKTTPLSTFPRTAAAAPIMSRHTASFARSSKSPRGSVSITAVSLSQEGRVHDAVTVARTLLASAEAFDYRWPELHSGAATFGRPAPYPAACRPQSWSAASAVALLSVALGPRPDTTTRTLHLHPVRPAAYGAMRFEGCGSVAGASTWT